MQKLPAPSSLYVLTAITIILGVDFGQEGAQWVLSIAFGEAISIPLFVGAAYLLVGILDVVAGVGFFLAKRWSWMLGIIAAILSAIFSTLAISAEGLPLSTGIVSIILPLIMIYCLAKPSVRTYLRFAKNIQD